MYNTTSIPMFANGTDIPMAARHLKYVYNTPKGHSRCFVLDDKLKFSYDFRKSKPKRSKRLFYMSCPTLPFFSVGDRTIGAGRCDA